jgi:hypothetical protein
MDGPLDRDVYNLIAEIIKEETTFLRHYLALVVNNVDPIKKGRVLVLIPELGFDTPDAGMWSFPRQSSSMIVPEVNDYVEIYFMAGDPNRPVFIYPATEMADMVPVAYDGLPGTKVVFQSKKTGYSIIYNDLLAQLIFNKGTEPFVLGNLLLTFLNNLVTNININYIAIQTSINSIPAPTPYVPVNATAPSGSEVSKEIFGK